MFETQVKTAGAADLIRLLRGRLGLALPEVAYDDLESVGGNTSPEVRYQRTRALLLRAARQPGDAGTLYDHPILRLRVGGHLAYLEPDVVAFQAGGRFHVVEIKSFAVIDGQADEESVAAAAMQAAVYVLALQDLLTAEDLPASAVSASAILVTRENFSSQPTATMLDVRKQVSVLRRQLARMTRISTLLDALPPGVTFDLMPDPDGTPARPRAELAAALGQSRPGTSHAACAPASWRASAATKPAQPAPWTCWDRPCARTSAAWTASRPRWRSRRGRREPSADQADITRALRHARTLRDDLAGGAA